MAILLESPVGTLHSEETNMGWLHISARRFMDFNKEMIQAGGSLHLLKKLKKHQKKYDKKHQKFEDPKPEPVQHGVVRVSSSSYVWR